MDQYVLEGDIDKKKNFDKLLKQIGKEVEEREEKYKRYKE